MAQCNAPNPRFSSDAGCKTLLLNQQGRARERWHDPRKQETGSSPYGDDLTHVNAWHCVTNA